VQSSERRAQNSRSAGGWRLVTCGLWLVATGLSHGCLFSGAADRSFEQEFRAFRYGIYEQFPDLGDTLVGYQMIMNRVDSMCADFLAHSRRELDGYFERSLQRLPTSREIDPAVYEHKDSLVWGDTVSLEPYFAEQKSLLKVINCSPEWLASSYRAMFLTRSLGVGEYGKYQLLNTLGLPRITRIRLGPDRVALLIDTWHDIVKMTLAGKGGNYKSVRLDRYVRPPAPGRQP
jgi:hypothetical protein